MSQTQAITEHVTWFEDTCSVYVVTHGDGSLLLDCGTVLQSSNLAAAQLPPPELVLLTHFHRDQCGGGSYWQQQGAELTIPFAERRFLEETDLLKAAYDIYDNYTAYFPGRGPMHDMVAARYAHDYSRIDWHDLTFEVVPLPGHTFGSVGYLFEVDGQRLLACGDLMSGPGRLYEYFWAQWRYMDFQGHVHLLESLRRIADLGIDLILPGHGRPFAPTGEAIGRLQRPLEELYELFFDRPYKYYQPKFRELTPHVFEVNTTANTYIVCDDLGHALLIDCGYADNAPIAANPHRFIDNFTPYLETELGIHTVDWFLPSHYHDDHLAGLPALQIRYATRLAASPELKDILENPQNYDMPCAVPHGVKVDRVIQRDEPFHWRGIDFWMEQQPGQTWYHHLIRFEVDNHRFLCIGDNVSGLCFQERRDFIHSFIPKNRTPVSSYPDMPRQILDYQPDIILTGHGGAVPFERDQVERWQTWMGRWQSLLTDIIDQPHPNYGMDPHWVEFYPYKVRIRPGDTIIFTVRITNHDADQREGILRFRSVDGVLIEPEDACVQVQANSRAHYKVKVRFPHRFATHALPVVVDVTWNGQHLGPIAEAVAYW